MIEWILFGSIFNFLYFGLGINYFVIKMNIKNIDYLLEQSIKFNFIGTDDIQEMKKQYHEDLTKPYEITFRNVLIDLIIYPIHLLSLGMSIIDYISMRYKK